MNKRSMFLLGGFCCFLAVLFITGCDKKVAKQAVVAPAAIKCDTIEFNKNIKPIIDLKCATPGCHVSTFTSADFTGYSGLNAKVTGGQFKNRVFSASAPMPPSGKLPQNQLDIIQCWLDNGAPNN
jgi:hypothetical protein